MVSVKIFTKDQREPIFFIDKVIALSYAKKYLNENNKCRHAGKEYCFFQGFNPNFHTRIPVIIKREFPVGSAQDYL